ncbi:thioredoxin-dependent thiol peroxidase [Marinilabiliaceae bacterium ANBcel2]|nr:thioredoxin-dependent thiol peroxidase [Marinilabiliaceae bacterium ANBcel2]
MTHLKEGMNAPLFEGIDQNGEKIILSELKGNKVILYFYPKDNTPGCTAEACNLNENYESLKVSGFVIIGVSPDSIESHKKFSDKHNLDFSLIADTDREIIKQYGVWGEKKVFGKIKEGVFRTTFLIDEDGVISSVISNVKTKNHAEQIKEII